MAKAWGPGDVLLGAGQQLAAELVLATVLQQFYVGFYDYGILLVEQHLLGRDGIHLTKPAKGISASRMADLVRRASK